MSQVTLQKYYTNAIKFLKEYINNKNCYDFMQTMFLWIYKKINKANYEHMISHSKANNIRFFF